jgi:hypothetical protein
MATQSDFSKRLPRSVPLPDCRTRPNSSRSSVLRRNLKSKQGIKIRPHSILFVGPPSDGVPGENQAP